MSVVTLSSMSDSLAWSRLSEGVKAARNIRLAECVVLYGKSAAKMAVITLIALAVFYRAVCAFASKYVWTADRLSDICKRGDLGSLKLAYMIGAHIENIRCEGNSLLHIAAKHKCYDMVEFFFQQKFAFCFSKNGERKTPFQIALETQDEGIVQLFVRYGAIAENDEEITRLTAESPKGIQDMLESVIEKKKQAYRLCDAVAEGDVEEVRTLLTALFDPNKVDRKECPPLYRAVEEGHFEIAKLLLEHGADVNRQWMTSYPMDVAVHNDAEQMVALLKQHGAEERVKSDWGVALHSPSKKAKAKGA